MGRSSLSRAKRGATRTRTARPGLYPPALSLQGSHRRGGTGEEPDQVQSAIQGGKRLCRAQTQVWVRQGALSRTGQECEPPVCDLRAGEFVLGAQATVARYGGVVPHEAAEPTSRQKQTACLVRRTKPPATPVSALRFAVKITCSRDSLGDTPPAHDLIRKGGIHQLIGKKMADGPSVHMSGLLSY